jgi:hypothetical protein
MTTTVRLTAHPILNQYLIAQVRTKKTADNTVTTGLIQVDSQRHSANVYTGMLQGDVPVTIESLDATPAEPPLDGWDAVVEVSMVFNKPVHLEDHINETSIPLPILHGPGEGRSYRLRVHARGQQQAAARQEVLETDEGYPVEEHLLQFWPAPIGEEKVYKDLAT